MLTIKCIGGIGNQMFQIALGESLRIRNKKVCLDIGLLEKYTKEKKWCQAHSLFDINIPVVRFGKFKRYSFKLLSNYYLENENGNYEVELLNLTDAYLDGYWQSYKYFKDYYNEISKLFKFPPIDITNQNYLKLIQDKNISISLHIRMGDYLYGANKEIYGNICTEEYYRKAICYFKNKYTDCHFFVFSNDKEYIQKFNYFPEFTIIDCNDEINAWQDMYLMSKCNHNIIANSSFSWWGAWLNQHENKEIIAPHKWMNTKEMRDIYPNEWIRI